MPKGVGRLMKSVCLQFSGRTELSEPFPAVDRFAKYKAWGVNLIEGNIFSCFTKGFF